MDGLDGGPCSGWVHLWFQIGDSRGGEGDMSGDMQDSRLGQIWGVLGGLSLQQLWPFLFGTYFMPGSVVNVLPFNLLSSSMG